MLTQDIFTSIIDLDSSHITNVFVIPQYNKYQAYTNTLHSAFVYACFYSIIHSAIQIFNPITQTYVCNSQFLFNAITPQSKRRW